MIKEEILKQIKESSEVKLKLAEKCADEILQFSELVVEAYKKGKKIILFGNGGSASDALHIAAEFVARFKLERRSLPAIALPANVSTITAIANDYGYEKVFSRQIEAFGEEGDIAVAITTGTITGGPHSKNIIEGANAAKKKGMTLVGLTGKDSGLLKDIVDLEIAVPSDNSARIQESHIMIGHIMCKLVEVELFGGQSRFS